jgi:glucokinase
LVYAHDARVFGPVARWRRPAATGSPVIIGANRAGSTRVVGRFISGGLMRATYAVGVDVGGTHIAVGLMELGGRVVKQTAILTPQNSAEAVIDAIVALVAEASAGVEPTDIAGIGIGLPAQIDFRRQSVEWCTNLPLAGVDVRALVSAGTGHEVTIENDGHCAGIGELRFGAAKGVRDVVMITLGTGVGGALLLDGEPYRGSRGLAGEIGHMVVRIGGAPCPCGADGHLEAYVGSRSIGARGQEAARSERGEAMRALAGGDRAAVTAEHVVRAAAAGDEAARDILLETGEILGEALVGIVNLLNPRLIVVGGGVGESADALVARAGEVIAEKALEGRCDVKVVQALLSNDAGILGAAALAFDESDKRENRSAERG